jgi:hypothetical protein
MRWLDSVYQLINFRAVDSLLAETSMAVVQTLTTSVILAVWMNECCRS